MNGTSAIQIFNSIADGDGGTLDLTGSDLPDYGYFVGGNGHPLVFDSVEHANHSSALSAIMKFVRDTSARYIGWWTDDETGKVYVDGTDWLSLESGAAALGRTRGEIAIWDIARGRELRLAYVAS